MDEGKQRPTIEELDERLRKQEELLAQVIDNMNLLITSITEQMRRQMQSRLDAIAELKKYTEEK
jgi:uncharacterized coiled-coil protein SlyX